MERKWNFNPGPAALPLSVLEKVQQEFLDYHGTGLSIIEHSHRGKDYDRVHHRAMELLGQLLSIPNDYKILFLQGGASLQFAMIPMNFLGPDDLADYILTGAWSEKALKEANIVASGRIAASSKDKNFSYIPPAEQLNVNAHARYVHLTSNNTIYGTQWQSFPDTSPVPLIADMSSDILSRKIDVSQFGLIYAGAQKNLGPAGLTVVIIRNDLLDLCRRNIPTMLSYRTFAEKDSLYNTPPTFSIYVFKLVLEWLVKQGGVEKMESINRQKAELIYNTIDSSNGFYIGTADKNSRSHMNVCFRLQTEELEDRFLRESLEAGFVGLKGHRSVGGVRVSLYNAVPLEAVEKLVGFMEDFKHSITRTA